MSTNQKIFFSLILLFIFALMTIFFLQKKMLSKPKSEKISNVKVLNGKQTIEISAKGGFQPKTTYAAANLPTILKISTNNTFDCSATINIPEFKVSEILPFTGTKEIDLGIVKKGVVRGSCSMGMYDFQLIFN